MNPLESSGKPLFFKVADEVGTRLSSPPGRKGTALRTAVQSLSLMQKGGPDRLERYGSPVAGSQ